MCHGLKSSRKCYNNSPGYWLLLLVQHNQVATRDNGSGMTTVFHYKLYGRFIKIQSNLRGKKLYRTSQGSPFFGGGVSDRDNVRAQHLNPFSLGKIEKHVLLDSKNSTNFKHHKIEKVYQPGYH